MGKRLRQAWRDAINTLMSIINLWRRTLDIVKTFIVLMQINVKERSENSSFFDFS
jgi:hypothetical protein